MPVRRRGVRFDFRPHRIREVVAVEGAGFIGVTVCIHAVSFYENRRELQCKSRDYTI